MNESNETYTTGIQKAELAFLPRWLTNAVLMVFCAGIVVLLMFLGPYAVVLSLLMLVMAPGYFIAALWYLIFHIWAFSSVIVSKPYAPAVCIMLVFTDIPFFCFSPSLGLAGLLAFHVSQYLISVSRSGTWFTGDNRTVNIHANLNSPESPEEIMPFLVHEYDEDEYEEEDGESELQESINDDSEERAQESR